MEDLGLGEAVENSRWGPNTYNPTWAGGVEQHTPLVRPDYVPGIGTADTQLLTSGRLQSSRAGREMKIMLRAEGLGAAGHQRGLSDLVDGVGRGTGSISLTGESTCKLGTLGGVVCAEAPWELRGPSPDFLILLLRGGGLGLPCFKQWPQMM